jgi:flagellar biosynthesis repressor protein FlbT
MPLKITLKPGERLILSGAAITNGKSTANLLIDNKVPILREKDILGEKDATSPARRIYFVIQLMYLDPMNIKSYKDKYIEFTEGFEKAVSSSKPMINKIRDYVAKGEFYLALKEAKKIIKYEKMILPGLGS